MHTVCMLASVLSIVIPNYCFTLTPNVRSFVVLNTEAVKALKKAGTEHDEGRGKFAERAIA